jgi:GNAT superfamily N-acetyltransferase
LTIDTPIKHTVPKAEVDCPPVFVDLAPHHIDDVSAFMADPVVNATLWHSYDSRGFAGVLMSWIKSNTNVCIVAVQRGRAVGIGRLDPCKHAKRGHVGIVGPIAIHPAWQGHGYGSAILRELLSAGNDRRLSRIEASFPAGERRIRAMLAGQGFRYECLHEEAFRDSSGAIVDLEQWITLRRVIPRG